MNPKIKDAIENIQSQWQPLTMESIDTIRDVITTMATDSEIAAYLKQTTQGVSSSVEFFRDPLEGFVMVTYAEARGTYRDPHNHGNAWVIYAVVAGEIEMGSYINSPRGDGTNRLVKKSRETLKVGDTRIYFSGEIHDTLCVSESAVVLRLTSTDLRREEAAGRMTRFTGEEA